MAKDNSDIGRTVVTAEVVETIMHKLGITSTIEELVESYNMTLPIGFPIFLMNIAPLLMAEDTTPNMVC